MTEFKCHYRIVELVDGRSSLVSMMIQKYAQVMREKFDKIKFTEFCNACDNVQE